MLPLWRDSLYIALHPSRIVLVRKSVFGAVIDSESYHCDAAATSEPWTNAVSMLHERLADPRWGHTRATIVLSNQLVRYAIIPWQAALNNEAEIQLYARHQFAGIYGQQVSRWDIRLSPAGHRQARLASAIDTALLNQLRSLDGVRLHSIQPYLMAAFNHWSAQLNRLDFWFVAAEPHRLVLALVRNGQWATLRNHALNTSLTEALPLLLEQEAMLSGQSANNTPVFVYAPEQERPTLPVGSRWDIILSHDIFATPAPDLAIALSGAY